MLRPGAGLFDWAALLSLLSAVLYGFAQLMARKMGDTVTASVMTFYQNGVYLVGSLVFAGIFALTGIGERQPSEPGVPDAALAMADA